MGYQNDIPENQGGKTIMFAPWPKPLDEDFRGHYGLDACYLDMANARYELVTQGRNLRREAGIAGSKKVKYVLKPASALSAHDLEVIKLLLHAEVLQIDPDYQPGKGTPRVHSELGELYLPLEGVIDVAVERARLKKELEKAQVEVTRLEERLSNPLFVQRVPPKVLEEHRTRLAECQVKRDRLLAELAALEG